MQPGMAVPMPGIPSNPQTPIHPGMGIQPPMMNPMLNPAMMMNPYMNPILQNAIRTNIIQIQRVKAMREMQLIKEQNELKNNENNNNNSNDNNNDNINNNEIKKIIKIPIDDILLYVKNLTDKVSNELLTKLFKSCGNLTKWRRVKPTFGFVTFNGAESALRCLKIMNQLELYENKIQV